jgi:hypothetical protein
MMPTQIRALAMKFDEAFNKNDAVAIAALYKGGRDKCLSHNTLWPPKDRKIV